MSLGLWRLRHVTLYLHIRFTSKALAEMGTPKTALTIPPHRAALAT
jgi:hypothetical protein